MCIGTGTAIAIAVGAGTAGAGMYAANKQAGASDRAVTAQTTAADKAAELQAKSAADALAYTKQQAELARQDAAAALVYNKGQAELSRRDADTVNRGSYDQWRATQRYGADAAAARARNINALGAQYGVAPREIPTFQVPEYLSTAANGSGVEGPASAGAAPAPSAAVPNGDYQSWFLSQVAGKPYNQQTLLDLERSGALSNAGVTLTPANAAGERTKINVPGLGWVRVGFGEGKPVWVPQAVSAGGTAAASAAPGTIGAAMVPPAATPTPIAAAALPPVNPALTVDPYQRRTVRDYFAA